MRVGVSVMRRPRGRDRAAGQSGGVALACAVDGGGRITSTRRTVSREAPRAAPPLRELTYVPDLSTDGSENVRDAAARLGGRLHTVGSSGCVVLDRRWDADDWHGKKRVSSFVLDREAPIGLFDPARFTFG